MSPKSLTLVALTLAGGTLMPIGSLGAQQTTSPLASVPGIKITRDVDYVPGAESADAGDRLDVFMPQGAQDVPVVVFFHGGELLYGDKSAGETLAARLVPHGIGVVSANYRLSPAVMHPAHVQDAAAAVAWVLHNITQYGGDPHNVFVSGHSAGGYLAALLALDDKYLGAHQVAPGDVKGWIPIAPFLYVEETAPDRPKTVWGDDPAAWLAASVTPLIGLDKGRWLLIYADGDDEWRRAQIDRFTVAMTAAGNPEVTRVQVPNRTHTTLMTALADDDDRIGDLVMTFMAHGTHHH
jgi:acetyl esterase/lipase